MSEKLNLPEFPDRKTLLEYLKGGLTPSERHRIERLMLENPSFRDAMEALESEEPELIGQDLSELSGRIQSRSRKVSGTGFSYYRLAATISLIILASVIVYMVVERISINGQEKNLSLKQDTYEESMDSLKNKKSVEAADKTPDANDLAQKESNQNKPKPGKITQKESGQAVAQLNNPTVSKQKQGEKMEDQREKEPVLRRAERVAVRENETPVPHPEIQAVTENQVSTEEKIRPDGIPGESLMDRDEPLTSTEAGNDLSRSVEIRAEEKAPAVVMKKTLFTGQPQPVIGIENYRKYLEDSLRYPAEAIKNKVVGEVRLNFTIGSDSIPNNIMITKSLGYGCDREAIRLNKEGPHWKPVMQDGKVVKKEVELSVPFKIPQ